MTWMLFLKPLNKPVAILDPPVPPEWAKYSNSSTMKITAVSSAKFHTMIKTFKYFLCIVSKGATEIQDGE